MQLFVFEAQRSVAIVDLKALQGEREGGREGGRERKAGTFNEYYYLTSSP